MEYTLYSVAIALISGDKLYLSQRLATKNFPNKWQFAGGKLEEDEKALVGAKRELVEETGLTFDTERFEYVGPITGDPTTKICYVYKVVLTNGEKPTHTEKDTMTEWQLFTPAEALKLDLMPGLKTVIENLK